MRAAINWAVQLRLAHPTALWARVPLWSLARWMAIVYQVTGRLPK